MTAVAAVAGARGERLHFERFANADAGPRDSDAGFTVVLARTGREIAVPAGQTILDALLGAGLDIDYSCMEGTCAPASPASWMARRTTATPC
ncbi:2Fe-2S iron-sulfur cluster-binding protein [Methylobrevis pamukkalensis]|uniref:Phenoxybenzoate dioxygenase subunit beta n=1 Tax=Methylobrevis pamukkalensis TaxID=1439726 RepID=A0A1E3H7J3_9HYPH|nr:2Fe-2S iron-sulfur cluster binding domain-containing protein [Methylobrevis pamukkalensis]ODN72309.1 Phenoxybenzoate dioxygenase subunit beta [Methylobrevis pamukkalensis]